MSESNLYAGENDHQMVADIRSERRARKLAQKTLARKLAVSTSILSKWERGLAPGDTIDFARLAELFHCDADELRSAHVNYISEATPGEGYTTAVNDTIAVFDRVGQPQPNLPKVLDLFCGAGGFSFGLERSGYFQVTGGIDILPDRIATFHANHLNATAIAGDIRSYSIRSLAEAALWPDIVVGGAPCQGFSSIRPFRKLTEDDPRNSLFEQFVIAVATIEPKWCIFENVVGLLTHKRGEVLNSLLQALSGIGYRTDWRVLNAAHYGLPQNRERLIVVGSRDSDDFPWPTPTHISEHRSMAGKSAQRVIINPLFTPLEAAVTVIDAIGDLPSIPAGGRASEYDNSLNASVYARALRGSCDHLTLHESTNHSERMLEIIKHSGASRAALPNDITSSGFSSSYSRLDANKPSVTLTVNFVHPASNKCIHPFQDRALTPREGARIQSFPDQFNFRGTRAQVVKQIGNAVPPLLGEVIGTALAQVMNLDSRPGKLASL